MARAPDCGSGGRWFNSSHSPHISSVESKLSVFRYDELVQKALISVVKEVLSDVAKDGLSGNHHFYIRFRTDHPQTRVPKFLKERHPEEVMVVLQHQFWNLDVNDFGFSVELSFDNIRETLYVPYNALTAFVDPSVKFALQFIPRFDSNGDPSGGSRSSGGSGDSSPQINSGDNIIRFDSFKKK